MRSNHGFVCPCLQRPTGNEVGHLGVVVSELLLVGLRLDEEVHHFGRVAEELLGAHGQANQRHALDGLATEHAQLGRGGVLDDVHQARHKPKKEKNAYF